MRNLLIALLLATTCFSTFAIATAAPATQPVAAMAGQPASASDLTAELNRLSKEWIKKLGGDGFAGAVHSPFAIVTDGDARAASRYMQFTVLGSTQRFQKQYMKAVADKPIVILLFHGQDSYRKACKDVLGVSKPPYYGFCRTSERLLVMDINTGGGTLVHELVHVMIGFDFPEIPDWFNEGMGSLYEQCDYRENRLVGLVNWRLPGLQEAMAKGKLGKLEALPGVDFRGANEGLNYAQARYLCMYMQEKGMLEDFYRTFRDRRDEDPTGLKFLKEAFAPKSLADVDKEWRAWVKTLKFR
jgi:hypothetical protein